MNRNTLNAVAIAVDSLIASHRTIKPEERGRIIQRVTRQIEHVQRGNPLQSNPVLRNGIRLAEVAKLAGFDIS